jgi:hypothetical protein
MEGRRNAVAHVGEDVCEFRELVHVFTAAPRREHLVGGLIYLVLHPVIGTEESQTWRHVLSVVFVSAPVRISTKPIVYTVWCVPGTPPSCL